MARHFTSRRPTDLLKARGAQAHCLMAHWKLSSVRKTGAPSSRMRKIADANVRFAGTAINTVGRHLRLGFGLPRLLLVGTLILLPCVGWCPGILVPVKRQL